jgi:hypothetical protein
LGSDCNDACGNCGKTEVQVYVDAANPNSICADQLTIYLSAENCVDEIADWNGTSYWIGVVCNPNASDCAYVDYNGVVQTCYTCASDFRAKGTILTLNNTLENISKMQVVEYDWNEKFGRFSELEKLGKLHTIGLIAQNISEIYPTLVKLGSDGYYRIEYDKLNAVLVEGIKEQQIFIEDIDKQLKLIETKLS